MSGQPEPATVKQAALFRLYPNEVQAGQMRQWIGAGRALWNHLLDLQKSTYAAEQRFLSAKALDQERQRWEKEPECDWRRAAPSQARQRIVIELDKALRDFFKSRKGQRAGARLGFPRFKRKMPSGAFYLANTRFQVSDDATSVTVSKLGELRLRGGRVLGGRVLGARVRHTAGHWHLAVQFEGPPPRVYGTPSLDSIGVDVGLKAAVARSDGVVIEAPKFFRAAEKRLRRMQRGVSRSLELSKKTGTRVSNRGRRKLARVARLHETIGDHRRDFLHTISSRIVGKAEVIGIETLNIKAMAKGRLSKSIADAGMGELHRQIIYKAGWSGRKAVKIGRFEPSTKTCSSCGQLHDMPLSRRTMRCDCGLVLDRDVNAARNIRRIAVNMVGAVSAEPAPKQEPTDVEIGVQTAAARPLRPVPVAEASSAKQRTRGRGLDVHTRVGEPRLRKGKARSPSPGPLFEWGQHDSS